MNVNGRQATELTMQWYLVHTKPRQEECAKHNLEQQGYQCYLPTLPSEKLNDGTLVLTNDPLFPRYLFIRLGRCDSAKSWIPIRSTRGVSSLVRFGTEPAKVDEGLIEQLRAQEAAVQGKPARMFSPGERVRFREGAFADVEGIYQMADGDRRVMVLIELLSKPVVIRVAPGGLRKAG